MMIRKEAAGTRRWEVPRVRVKYVTWDLSWEGIGLVGPDVADKMAYVASQQDEGTVAAGRGAREPTDMSYTVPWGV